MSQIKKYNIIMSVKNNHEDDKLNSNENLVMKKRLSGIKHISIL